MSEVGRINRQALVRRHNPRLRVHDPLSPLSVGNGSFAFTADITGLQTFPDEHAAGMPLCTQSQWGWHSFPNPEGYTPEDALVDIDVCGRMVPYIVDNLTPAGAWLRENPHRLDLSRIGFEIEAADGESISLEEIESIDQTLDLWRGLITSRFIAAGKDVVVRTCCHPEIDLLAVKIASPLVGSGQLKVIIRFPYGSSGFGADTEGWHHPDRHQTSIAHQDEFRTDLERTLDNDSFAISIRHPNCRFAEGAAHEFELVAAKDAESLEFEAAFAASGIEAELPTFEETITASEDHWRLFWETGAAIDLAGSADPRADELERRIVLSQYVTAIQCAGDIPPQETGLTCNSWYGKFHLEMHWWHAVHFALWDRLPLLEKSLGWYRAILPEARQVASRQGYAGVRWPKMVDPRGVDSPSNVGPYLIWQQPHPIYYAELVYRQRSDTATLERYKELVFETAEFMASYARWDEERQEFVLGPQMIPAQECYDPSTTMNPPFELEYWHWGLGTAQRWRERLGLQREPVWDRVIKHLASPPVENGVYQTAEGIWKNRDHPSHLGALGVLPGATVDREAMRTSLLKVMSEWDWPSTWGWDYPTVAMCAARLGEPEIAIDALLMPVTKNTYLPNGHNYQSPRLPLYLPGNGGLLTAVAMMAAGWDGAPDEPNPGFPMDWVVRREGLRRMI